MRRLLDLPIRTKLSCVVALMAAELVLLLSLGFFGMWALSALRAYVGGEGLWAKEQKNAIYSLSSYALSRDERDWAAYQEHLRVPLGDHKARLALESEPPDYAASDAGFIEGGNHPDDARAMAHLFRRFSRVGYIRRAAGLWRDADATMDELRGVADVLHADAVAGRLTKDEARRRLRDIESVNARLTRIENDFSYTLGEASRWARRLLFRVMALGALLFGGLGLLVAQLISSSVAGGVAALAEGAARAETGDLSRPVEVLTRDEIGRLAEAFNRMAQGLARLDRMKSDFVATASHELRTPLTLAMAPLETLLAGDAGELTEEQKGLLRVMHNNAVRQLQLVNGLLDFSRLDAGRVEVKREPLDAAALTRSIIDDFRPLARGKQLELSLRALLGQPTVSLDRYLYERVVFNLVSNAVKFTPRGGHVRVVLLQSGDRLRLRVEDNGVGVAPEDRARLFEKFRQLDSSSTRRFEGTGLGLALVREFTKLLGGNVTVSGAPGRGSEFEAAFHAPPAEADAVAIPRPRTPALAQRWDAGEALSSRLPEPGGPAGVLVAEDNAELATYLARVLSELCPVRVARDGEEALAMARELLPELVITDVMMPRLDGLGLCRALKAAPETAGVPVLLLTALTDREALTRGWKAGADEYLFKPFHPKEVLVRVRAMLETARARRRHEEEIAGKNRELERNVAEVAAANEELKSFSYSVAHDLRGPLRNLGSFCSELEKVLPPEALNEDAREFLKRIHNSVLRLDGIIEGLLQLSRVARADVARVDFDLNEAARAIGTELRRAHPGREVELRVAEGLRASTDPNLTRVILRNLLENAWKFTSKKSKALIEVGARDHDGVFYVRDDGAGFDMKFAAGLFKAFQRLHSPVEFPGHGIGLATTRRAVDRLGGRIWAEAATNAGAVFYFSLEPVTKDAAAPR